MLVCVSANKKVTWKIILPVPNRTGSSRATLEKFNPIRVNIRGSKIVA
jgi:hypothetical protein